MQNDEFSNISIKNQDNKHIINEFIRYYRFIYSNYSSSLKTSKETYYKLHAIKKVIYTISNYKNKIISGEQLSSIKGIGIKTIKRLDEILQTGQLSEITEKEHQYESITKLSQIYGIGLVKASSLYENFNIKSIDDLIKAAAQNKITLTHQMQLGIKYKDTLNNNIPHNLITLIEPIIIKKIKASDNELIPTICGSYRRNKEFSSDIDILITHPALHDTKGFGIKSLINQTQYGIFMNKVVSSLDNIFIIDKLTESSKIHFQGFATLKHILKNNNNYQFDIKNNIIRLDIIIVPIESYYTALMHFTGSAVFNQKMRIYAKSLNMKLSEYGLYKLVKNKYIPIKIHSEEDIFDKLLLKYIPPEKR